MDRGSLNRTGLFSRSKAIPADGVALAARITWAASKQSYFTIRLLVDRDKVADAFRAYAYFRWVDDTLDGKAMHQSDRLAFLDRQRRLYVALAKGANFAELAPRERLLAELLSIPAEKRGGLDKYIENLMAVMAFDPARQGRLVSQPELDQYTYHLAAGVTEAVHYFIGGSPAALRDGSRYLAATAAHIAHMLRDAHEDVAAGYLNIPQEYLAAHHIGSDEFAAPAYRQWVHQRVSLARTLFKSGREYLAGVKSLRCRLACFAYIARFERLLNSIEREGYLLRPAYPERRGVGAGLATIWSVFSSALRARGDGNRSLAPIALRGSAKSHD